MPCLKLVAVISLLLHGLFAWSADITIQYKDKAEIAIPDAFFNDIEKRESNSLGIVLTGRHATSDARFFIVRTTSELDTNQILARLIDIESINTEDLSEPGESEYPAPKRILTPGPYFDFLFVQKEVEYRKTKVVFFLVGPQEDFYQATPDFWNMTSLYKPAPMGLKSEVEVQGKMIVLAIFLLFANTLLIWVGVRQYARSRQLTS